MGFDRDNDIRGDLQCCQGEVSLVRIFLYFFKILSHLDTIDVPDSESVTILSFSTPSMVPNLFKLLWIVLGDFYSSGLLGPLDFLNFPGFVDLLDFFSNCFTA